MNVPFPVWWVWKQADVTGVSIAATESLDLLKPAQLFCPCINCLVPKLPKIYFQRAWYSRALISVGTLLVNNGENLLYYIHFWRGKSQGEGYLSVFYTVPLKHRSWQCKFTFQAKLFQSSLLCAATPKPSTPLSLSSIQTYKGIIK